MNDDDIEIQDVTAEELEILRELAESIYIKPGEDATGKTISYPYAVTCGAVTVTGIFYAKNPLEDSWTEGVVAGAVNGTYKISKKKAKAKLYGPWTKVEVEIMFDKRDSRATYYAQDILTAKWHRKARTRLVKW
jgi:hypothetical protein